MKILFSPLGMTDPISNFRDGSMLHICRYYDIDKVYLYMSKEVYDHHINDNRYVYCLEKLGDLMGKKIEHELIIRKDLVEVQIFDYFLTEYETLLKDIHQKNPGAEIYLNVSSGSPAMKNALQQLSAMLNFKTTPIQCSTPEKKSNPHKGEIDKCSPEEQWECNDDNSDPKNRCEISENYNFIVMLKKKMIEELILKYDYIGAKALISENMSLTDKFKELLDAACERYMLRFSVSNAVFRKYGFDVAENEITNYLRCLDLKVKKEEYADFIRAITPLIVDLFENILASDTCGNFRLKDYTAVDKKNVEKWNISKLSNDFPDIISALDSKFGGRFNGGNVYSIHLVEIINKRASDNKLSDICCKLRSIEENVRNITAHEIVSVNDKWIHKRTGGYYSADIIKLLYDAMCYTPIKPPRDFFNSYDKMNELLIKSLYEN